MTRKRLRKPHRVAEPLRAFVDSVVATTLANGLRVRLLPSHAVPMCSLYLVYRVGSRNERPGITGISHLFEHMMFNGSAGYGPGSFDRLLESNGGASNAYTSTDITMYHEDFMSDALNIILDLEADRMRALVLTEKKLAAEQAVVLEERRLRVDNEIDGVMDEELASLVWRAHAYRWPVIGWAGDISNISVRDCEDFYATYYAPNNAILCLAGDFDPVVALKAIERRFRSARPSGRQMPEPLDAEAPAFGERRSEVLWPALAPSLLVGWRGPPASHQDALALDLLQYVLGVGQASRLKRSLMYDRSLVVGVDVDWAWRIDPGLFGISLQLPPGANARAVEAALFEQLAEIAKQGITEDELARARRTLTHHFYAELTTNGGRAHALATSEAILGDWWKSWEQIEAYGGIRSADVQRVAAQYLSEIGRCVVHLVPEAGARA